MVRCGIRRGLRNGRNGAARGCTSCERRARVHKVRGVLLPTPQCFAVALGARADIARETRKTFLPDPLRRSPVTSTVACLPRLCSTRPTGVATKDRRRDRPARA